MTQFGLKLARNRSKGIPEHTHTHKKKEKKKKERKRKFAFLIVFLAILVLSPAVEMKKCVQMVQISSLDTQREKFPP